MATPKIKQMHKSSLSSPYNDSRIAKKINMAGGMLDRNSLGILINESEKFSFRQPEPELTASDHSRMEKLKHQIKT